MSDELEHQALTIKVLREKIAELERHLAEARAEVVALKHDLSRIYRELNGG